MLSIFMHSLIHRERQYVSWVEKMIMNPSARGTAFLLKLGAKYFWMRHMVLYRAIRDYRLKIPSGWKVALALSLFPGDTFFDIGANIGLVTQPASWLVGRKGRVHSFEPSPSVVQCLRRRVELLGLKNVTINELALGSEPGSATLYEYSEHHGGASSLKRIVRSEYKEPTESRVKVKTLDDYVTENRIAPVRLIKLDVEGSEIDVLRGGSGLLVSQRPVLFVELSRDTNAAFGRTLSELLETIAFFGYAMFSWRPEGLIRLRSERDIPAAWHHDDAICLDMERHQALYRRLLSLSRNKFKLHI